MYHDQCDECRESKGVDAVLLSKLWRIDLKQAERTREVTSQKVNRPDDPTLSRNYRTNDRMLRYKRLDEYFYIFRSKTCCQLFVTDKGFVYVVPMKLKSDGIAGCKTICSGD
jgi:hypothetical protein